MLETTSRPYAHDAPNETFAAPQPLIDVPTVPERSAAEEARTLAATNEHGALASLSEGGEPWSSMVAYALLADGSPVLCVSTLAEHGRNLMRDERASLMIAQSEAAKDPLANGRVTLTGVAELVEGEAEEEAREAYVAKIPAAKIYVGFGDFSLRVLRVERVRWVGGYGRMDSATADSYRAAEADPLGTNASAQVNEILDAEALAAIGAKLGGHTDLTAARCTGIDRFGLWLNVETPRGRGPARVGFEQPVTAADDLADVLNALTDRARAA